jgi:hypothetical protein
MEIGVMGITVPLPIRGMIKEVWAESCPEMIHISRRFSGSLGTTLGTSVIYAFSFTEVSWDFWPLSPAQSGHAR